ncbi:MAG TPA: hypothetical protein VNB54_12210, partial [Alphaproteobacteria bacterium]|nr:hypothetical protein [Alphaproteobacteria bacterium]
IQEPEDNAPNNKVKTDIPEPDEKVIVGGHDPVPISAIHDPAVPRDESTLYLVKENFEAASSPKGKSSESFSDPARIPDSVRIKGTPLDRACEGGHTPGSKITCYVIFDGDFALIALYLSFYNPYVQPDQGGLCNSFMFQEKERVSADTYKVTGVLPACASGAYLLTSVQAHTVGGVHSYSSGSNYQNQYPVAWLENPHQTLLPDVIYVGSNPPPK